MTDRQIEVLLIIRDMVADINFSLSVEVSPVLKEFNLIIEEQKELNYAEFKDKRK